MHDLIKEDAHSLDMTNKPRFERYVQKLANAAHISFAERTLFYERNEFLNKVNDEAKKRRLCKSVILGRAKVMSYEDLEEARVKRIAKEKTNSKKNHRQKRKVVATEEDDFEPDTESEVAQRIKVPQLGRAPVARMY